MLNENAFLTKIRMEAHPKGAGNAVWGYLSGRGEPECGYGEATWRS